MIRPLQIAANEGETIAVGAQYPSGNIIVEWCRESFEPGERTAHPVTSHYQSVPDAEQASGGAVIYMDEWP